MLTLARQAGGKSKSCQTHASARVVHQNVGGFQVLVHKAALVGFAEGSGNAYGELKELRRLHRSAETRDERLAARILENQHRPPAIANEFHGPRGPCALEVVLQSEFMRETIDASGQRMVCGQAKFQRAARYPLVAGSRRPTKRELAVLPQHVERPSSFPGIERDVRSHLTHSAIGHNRYGTTPHIVSNRGETLTADKMQYHKTPPPTRGSVLPPNPSEVVGPRPPATQ